MRRAAIGAGVIVVAAIVAGSLRLADRPADVAERLNAGLGEVGRVRGARRAQRRSAFCPGRACASSTPGSTPFRRQRRRGPDARMDLSLGISSGVSSRRG